MRIVFQCKHWGSGGAMHQWEVESNAGQDLHRREAEIRDLLETLSCPKSMEGYIPGYKRCDQSAALVTVEYRA